MCGYSTLPVYRSASRPSEKPDRHSATAGGGDLVVGRRPDSLCRAAALGLIAALLGMPAAGPAAAEPSDSSDCPVCRSLTIVREPIYRPQEPAASTLYGRLANALHVRTRESVVRRGLHFCEGQPVCPDDLAASIRRLRSYPFLHSDIEICGYAPGDSVDLVVRTRDVWTTQVDFQISKEGGLVAWSVGARETNLLGLGKKISVRFGEDEVQTFWGVGLIDPQFLGSGLWVVTEVSHGGERHVGKLYIERPFERATTPWGLTMSVGLFAGSYVDHRRGLDGPEWDLDGWEFIARGGARVAGTSRRALRLMPAVYLSSDAYTPPEEGQLSELPPLMDWEVRAPGLTLGYFAERYAQISGVDAFEHREDLNLGTDIQLFSGYAMQDGGGSANGPLFLLEAQQGLALSRGRFARLGIGARAEVVSGRLFNTLWESTLRYYDRIDRWQTLAAR